jgi:flagellar basal-body rod protein FlgC
MKISILIFAILSSTAFATTGYEVETFCQNLNVILQKVQIHSGNIANNQTTRTIEGGYYKRKILSGCKNGHCKVSLDNTPPILKYLPNHPDANENGYVAFPNFSIHEEKAHLIKAQNAYDLVVGNMPVKSIELLKGHKLDSCFENYAFFKEQFDFQAYLDRR